MKVFFIILVCLSYVQSIEHQPNDNFGTKTNYITSLKIDESDQFFPKFNFDKQCSNLKHISAVYRHGSRYPSAKYIKIGLEIIQDLVPIGPDITEINMLKDALNKLNSTEEKGLSESGFKELEELGKELKMANPILFENLNKEDFNFYVTKEKRTVDSFKGFLKGLSPDDSYKPIPKEDNMLLRFFDQCKKYNEVKENKTSQSEVEDFMKSKVEEINNEMKPMYIENITPYTFNQKQLKTVYSIAGTEYAVNSVSVWDMFLNQKSAKLLEYAADLKNFWGKGGGYPINYLQSCVLLRHLFNNFDNVIDGKNPPKGNFYFAHAETLLPLYYLMGLFVDDEPLTSLNYIQQQNRKFKTTRVVPFAANIRFELSDCENKTYIALFMKNHELKWPCCDSFKCEYVKVKKYYEKVIDTCDFNQICLNNNAIGLNNSLTGIVSAVMVLIMILFNLH